MAEGRGGVPPRNLKRGKLPTLTTPPRVGPKTPANPKPTRVGKRGGQGGEAPMAGGVGGVPPRNQKRERVAHINKPATSGTQNAGEPSANGGGQNGGPGGASPLPGGLGDVPPKWRVANHSTPATSAQKPKAHRAHMHPIRQSFCECLANVLQLE